MRFALAVLLVFSFNGIWLSAQGRNELGGNVVCEGNPNQVGQCIVRQTGPSASFGIARIEGFNVPHISACPVAMRAQHRSDGNLMRVQGAHATGTGQWLHLTLSSLDSKQIVKAALTVHGVSPKGRLQNAEPGTSPSSITRTVTVPFAASAGGGFSADLWVPGMTAVQRIDLLAIRYADGSTWSLADGQSCYVEPDLFMLTASR